MNNLNKIIKLILQDAENEKHPDKITRIRTVLMQVNMAIGKEMERIQNDDTK